MCRTDLPFRPRAVFLRFVSSTCPHPAHPLRKAARQELLRRLNVLGSDLDAHPRAAVVRAALANRWTVVAARPRGRHRERAPEELHLGVAGHRYARRLFGALLHDNKRNLDRPRTHVLGEARKVRDLALSRRRLAHEVTLEMVMALVVAQHEELVGESTLVVRADALQVAHS